MNTLVRRRKKAAAEQEADDWNRSHIVGQAVIVTRDDGSELRTTTRSNAWVLGGHTAVVMVVGIAGGYKLDRVRPVPTGDNG